MSEALVRYLLGLELIPYSEPIPLLWSLSQIDSLLAGTELHKENSSFMPIDVGLTITADPFCGVAGLILEGYYKHIVKDDKALIYEDWKECIEPLLTSVSLQLKAEHFGVKEYLAAKSLIASRSFEIDEYHGCGMVPLADLFNHKTGAEDVHFTSSYAELNNVADNENYGNDKTHSGGEYLQRSDLESSHSELDDDAHSDKHGNDDNEPTKVNSRDESISGSYSEFSSASEDDLTVLEMIMVKKVEAGAEVFNTYGSLGNAALLHSRRRLSLWRKLDYSGCVSQNSEYFEISFDGELQVELLILLYIILLPEEVFAELDLAVSITSGFEKSKGFNLSKKDIVLFREGVKSSNNMLLTDGVCVTLSGLADIRESLYGSNHLEDDIKTLNYCCLVKEPKIYYSLVLRISERRILEKLRCYASAGAIMQTKG
ncbi:hypothetical protein H5410_020974, partial [Solanum commersonii]